VNFAVAANTGTARTRNITVSGQTFTVSQSGTPSAVQFSSATYGLAEGVGSGLITVTRSGDSSGAATVDFATSDGSATQNKDYEVASGRLSFAAGETSKTFNVLIVDDVYVEGNETFTLTLGNATGATLASPTTATITITDNDTATPTTNPLDNADARFFVRQHYADFLSRNPDQGGFDFWSGKITACAGEPICIRNSRIDVSNTWSKTPVVAQKHWPNPTGPGPG
jgi:hypothetical protein